jgi:hypothetical protein
MRVDEDERIGGHAEQLTAGMLATVGVGSNRLEPRPRRADAVSRVRRARAGGGGEVAEMVVTGANVTARTTSPSPGRQGRY